MQLRHRLSRYALLAALAIAGTANAQTQSNEAASQAPNPTPGGPSEGTTGQPPSDTTTEAAPTRK